MIVTWVRRAHGERDSGQTGELLERTDTAGGLNMGNQKIKECHVSFVLECMDGRTIYFARNASRIGKQEAN